MKISYSFGIIDFVHIGHIRMLQQAKASADFHIFGLIDEVTANNWLGTTVSSYEERLSVIKSLNCIDEIMKQDRFDPTDNLKKIHMRYPDAEIILFHRSDWKAFPADIYIRFIGGKVELADYYNDFDPNNILKKLQNDKLESSSNLESDFVSTKANTLLSLRSMIHKSIIEPIFVVTARDFFIRGEELATEISKFFNHETIIVRSSSSNEDCFECSNAGHFKSILDVDSEKQSEINAAINQVFQSYGLNDIAGTDEQVLIQRQTKNVFVSGVVFTRDIRGNRPYYVINYDDSGSTESVTSGSGVDETLWICRDVDLNDVNTSWTKCLIEAIKEIECLLSGITLDIEFAITHNNEIVIFQVRPLAANYKFSRRTNDNDYFKLKEIIKDDYNRIPNSVRNETIKLSDMAFWNPAEMIGVNPHCLDYSLYRRLITKSAWNKGLVPMGYNAVDEELMYKIGNKPYISLDYSFKSLTPSSINNELQTKLMCYYYDKLHNDLSSHDKIEFEIVFNCYDFCTHKNLGSLKSYGFNEEEMLQIEKSLHTLTNSCIKNYFDSLNADKLSISKLNNICVEINSKRKDFKENSRAIIDNFKKIIFNIEQYGTPQFSRQARYAFIASSMYKSLVERGFWTEAEKDLFLMSVNTVAKKLESSINALHNGKLSRDEFNKQFGHLRSGTYDIQTDRYENIDFITGEKEKMPFQPMSSNTFSHDIYRSGIDIALAESHFNFSSFYFLDFLKSAIEGREWFKFEFTRSLSCAIELLVDLGKHLGIPREEMAFLEITDIIASESYIEQNELRSFLKTMIMQRKKQHKLYSTLLLPDVIWDIYDFDMVCIRNARPNFITTKCISGEVHIFNDSAKDSDLDGKIVAIEKADPGYDWIFTREIKGLITKYGGAASHMAIRCAEFDLPAAIGCGENIYQYVINSSTINLDCKNGKIQEIK